MPVYGSAPYDAFVLDEDQWSIENKNPGAYHDLPKRASPSMGQLVYNFVQSEIGRAEINAVTLANFFNLPERTLRHRLKKERTSVNRITALARCQQAMNLMAEGNSVADASSEVDLSSPQALCRLYTREMGISPQKHVSKIKGLGIKMFGFFNSDVSKGDDSESAPAP